MRRIWLVLVILVTASCGQRSLTPAPGSMPQPPSELAELPRMAWIKCTGDANLDQDRVYLWELPGVQPADPNSAYQGKRGNSTGLLAPCTQVQILEYAWSVWDKMFYVLVTNGQVKGWVTLDLLGFTPNRPASVTPTP